MKLPMVRESFEVGRFFGNDNELWLITKITDTHLYHAHVGKHKNGVPVRGDFSTGSIGKTLIENILRWSGWHVYVPCIFDEGE